MVFYAQRDRQAPGTEYRFFDCMKQCYPTVGEIILLPYDRIISNPFRSKESYSESALRQLVLSIQNNGLLKHICVYTNDDETYRIASGERRFRAAILAGLKEIPCLITSTVDSTTDLTYSLLVEMNHQPLHYLDRIAVLRKLADHGHSLLELSELCCMPLVLLSEELRLAELSDEIQSVIKQSDLPEPFAKLLLKADESQRIEILDQIIAEDMSLSEAKQFVRQLMDKHKRGNIMLFKDLNVFVNTVEHAVDTMRRCGITSGIERRETEETITYVITIQK